MYTLYYMPGATSMLPHMVLRELDLPFELRRVDLTKGEHRDPEYLKLNPHGRVPALVDGDGGVLYESGAIVLHLCDAHPESGLAPPPGSAKRAQMYKWMFYMATAPQVDFVYMIRPERVTKDPDGAPMVRAALAERMDGVFDRIAAELGDGPYLLGNTFSPADLQLFMLTRWGRNLPRPPRSLPQIAKHAERIAARPAVQAVIAAEGLQTPVF